MCVCVRVCVCVCVCVCMKFELVHFSFFSPVSSNISLAHGGHDGIGN